MAFCALGNHPVHPVGTACPTGNMLGQTRFQTAASLAAAQAALAAAAAAAALAAADAALAAADAALAASHAAQATNDAQYFLSANDEVDNTFLLRVLDQQNNSNASAWREEPF